MLNDFQLRSKSYIHASSSAILIVSPCITSHRTLCPYLRGASASYTLSFIHLPLIFIAQPRTSTRAGLFRGLWLSGTKKISYCTKRKKKRSKKKHSSTLYSLFHYRFLSLSLFPIVALPAVGTPEAPFLAARHCVNRSS